MWANLCINIQYFPLITVILRWTELRWMEIYCYMAPPTPPIPPSVECRVPSVECPSSVRRVSVECPSCVKVLLKTRNVGDVTRRSLDEHSTSLGGHSTDTRGTLDGTRRTLDGTRRLLDGHSTGNRHSALDTRWDWWCRGCIGNAVTQGHLGGF